jgi:hypothetical protein
MTAASIPTVAGGNQVFLTAGTAAARGKIYVHGHAEPRRAAQEKA